MIISGPRTVKITTSEADETAVIYRPPNAWPTDNRRRQFIPLSERQYSYETDLNILRRSVDILLKQQDKRGSFYTEVEYRSGDKVDDQLAGASMLAFLLSQTDSDQKINDSLERAVRFHLDHLVCEPSSGQFRYSRYVSDRDSSGDWCNTLWCLWGGALVLRHGTSYLTEETAAGLRDLMREYWSFVSTYAARDENPCHNQLVAYCHIGNLYAVAIGDKAIASELCAYYHKRLRRLRIKDRGHWIYSEFNQWDPHYGLVSWTALESLFAETGDPAYAEDADEIALYFNERVSAGGYICGGSRQNECGSDEFLHLPSNRAIELGLNRLLLPEPSHLWRRLGMDAHLGRTLVERMDLPLVSRATKRALPPTPWHFQKGDVSACLADDFKLLQVSSDGLEIIPAANALRVDSGVIWHGGGAWRRDVLQSQPPRPSEGHRYCDCKPIQLHGAAGLTTTQRGYIWETRQWWISNGNGLLWIGQLVNHSTVACDKMDYILGNPVLTRVSNKAVPVTEVETAEGARADTQGDAVNLSSRKFLKFGDIFVGATAPVKFIRPSKEAFHTFPVPGGRLLRDFDSSNELRVQLFDTPGSVECRESLFFAVEIGKKVPSLLSHRDPLFWRLEAKTGIFEARQYDGVWNYTFKNASWQEQLPQISFGFQSLDPNLDPLDSEMHFI
jgi:hypothetical protein